MPECLVTSEHTRDYIHMLFYIVYIPHLNNVLHILSHSNHEGYVWHKYGRDDDKVLHEK